MQQDKQKLRANMSGWIQLMNKNNFYKHFIPLLAGLFVLLATMLLSTNAYSKEFHPLDDITKTAHEFTINQISNGNEDGNIEVVVGQIDPRLRLHQCTIPLEAYSQNYEVRQGQSTVGVRCNDVKPWSLYIPISVKNFKPVATLKHAVTRNSIITDDDIALKKININRLSSGYFDDLTKLRGKILTQNLAKGAVLTNHHIKSPMAITRGQRVTVIAKNSTIEVRMEGTAMSKGAVGERIKVKNLRTKRIVEGIIINNHLISVNL